MRIFYCLSLSEIVSRSLFYFCLQCGRVARLKYTLTTATKEENTSDDKTSSGTSGGGGSGGGSGSGPATGGSSGSSAGTG